MVVFFESELKALEAEPVLVTRRDLRAVLEALRDFYDGYLDASTTGGPGDPFPDEIERLTKTLTEAME